MLVAFLSAVKFIIGFGLTVKYQIKIRIM